MPVYSCWEGEYCGIHLKPGADPPTACICKGPCDAVKVMEFEAANWDEANQRQYDHYGWGRYVTFEEQWARIYRDRPLAAD